MEVEDILLAEKEEVICCMSFFPSLGSFLVSRLQFHSQLSELLTLVNLPV